MNLANDFWVLGKNVSKWNHSLMQFCEVGWCLCTVIASSLPRALQIWGASGFWVLRLGFRSGLFDRRHWGRMEEILGLRELNEWRKKNPGRMVCAQRLPSILSKDFWTHLHCQQLSYGASGTSAPFWWDFLWFGENLWRQTCIGFFGIGIWVGVRTLNQPICISNFLVVHQKVQLHFGAILYRLVKFFWGWACFLSVLELHFGWGGIGWEIVTRMRNWPGGFNSVAVQSFASQAQDARVHSVEAQGQGETSLI